MNANQTKNHKKLLKLLRRVSFLKPMQEGHLSLAQHKDDGIEELEVLGVDEQQHPEAAGAVSVT